MLNPGNAINWGKPAKTLGGQSAPSVEWGCDGKRIQERVAKNNTVGGIGHHERDPYQLNSKASKNKS